MRLHTDSIEILHVIGGDDTNVQAGLLENFANQTVYGGKGDHKLVVVGIPKTIDNDITNVALSLGAHTAAIQSATFFSHIVNESTSSERMLIVHEVMGRTSGWLTAKSADFYRTKFLSSLSFPYGSGWLLSKKRFDIHAIIIPEGGCVDITALGARLKKVMDIVGCVNVFVSEGSCTAAILKEIDEDETSPVKRDAFGHIALDDVNAGKYFAAKLKTLISADKVLVQKSGYFARSAPAGTLDLAQIEQFTEEAVDSALAGVSGVVGEDETSNNNLHCIHFDKIAGGKPFNIEESWYMKLLGEVESYGSDGWREGVMTDDDEDEDEDRKAAVGVSLSYRAGGEDEMPLKPKSKPQVAKEENHNTRPHLWSP